MSSRDEAPASFSTLVQIVRELGQAQTRTPVQNGVVLAAAGSSSTQGI